MKDNSNDSQSSRPQVNSATNSNVGIPDNDSFKFLLDVFEKSVEKLEPGDREAVLSHHNRLMKSMSLLSEKMSEILSSEEGRRLMQQELQNRERDKK